MTNTLQVLTCPKCSGVGAERSGEILLQHREYPALQVQRWNECAVCEWTWTTIDQRKFNAQSYKNRWRVDAPQTV